MLFLKYNLRFLFFAIVTAETTKEDKIKEKNDDELKPSIQRRFLEDLDDKEWHVSHLRDMEFDTEGDCDDTFESKAKKYRETLKNDAALVEYVFAEALHSDKQDVSKGKCKQNKTDIFKTKDNLNAKSERNVTQNQTKKAYNIKEKSGPKITHGQHETVKNDTYSDGEVKTATVSVKEFHNQDKNTFNKTKKRRSEYQFSSVEYYDEVPDFDHSICPDAVDVITLELDQLRNYDVECEAILEWRSLE